MPSYVILSWVDVRHGWQRILNCFVNKPASCLFHSTSERAPQAWKFCQRFFVTSWFFFEIFFDFFQDCRVFFFFGGGILGFLFRILKSFRILGFSSRNIFWDYSWDSSSKSLPLTFLLTTKCSFSILKCFQLFPFPKTILQSNGESHPTVSAFSHFHE